jgi:hypothetical protein
MQTFLILDLGITSSAGTQLMQIPPAATGIAFCIISAYLIRQRKVSAFLVTLLSEYRLFSLLFSIATNELCPRSVVGGAFISFLVLLLAPQAGVRFAAVCVIIGAAPSAHGKFTSFAFSHESTQLIKLSYLRSLPLGPSSRFPSRCVCERPRYR